MNDIWKSYEASHTAMWGAGLKPVTVEPEPEPEVPVTVEPEPEVEKPVTVEPEPEVESHEVELFEIFEG